MLDGLKGFLQGTWADDRINRSNWINSISALFNNNWNECYAINTSYKCVYIDQVKKEINESRGVALHSVRGDASVVREMTRRAYSSSIVQISAGRPL